MIFGPLVVLRGMGGTLPGASSTRNADGTVSVTVSTDLAQLAR